jgi:diacylglycerol kinase (ATP)
MLETKKSFAKLHVSVMKNSNHRRQLNPLPLPLLTKRESCMAGQEAKGLKRVLNATIYSAQGFKAAFQNEAAFRQEFALALVLFPIGLWLGQTGLDKALLVSVLLLVLIVELLNSGIEAAIDRVGLEHHELSKRAKDIGSAAVFVSLLNVIVVWSLVLLA